MRKMIIQPLPLLIIIIIIIVIIIIMIVTMLRRIKNNLAHVLNE